MTANDQNLDRGVTERFVEGLIPASESSLDEREGDHLDGVRGDDFGVELQTKLPRLKPARDDA